jgi:hypothetical protein
MTHPAPPRWRKSSWSSQSDCVEVAATLDRFRDSKNGGVVLMAGSAGFAKFREAVKADRLGCN